MGRIGKTDTVPAMLTPGEAVLNKGAAELVGRDNIRRANALGMRVQGFEDGVDTVRQAASNSLINQAMAPSAPTAAGTPSVMLNEVHKPTQPAVNQFNTVPVDHLANFFANSQQNAMDKWRETVNAHNAKNDVEPFSQAAAQKRLDKFGSGYSASGPANTSNAVPMNGDYYAARAEQLGELSSNSAIKPVNTLGAGSSLNVHLGDDSAPGTKYVGGIRQAGAEAWGKQADRDTITPSITDSNQKPAYPQYGMQRPAAAQASSLQSQAAQSDYLSEFENWARQQDQELQGFSQGGEVKEIRRKPAFSSAQESQRFNISDVETPSSATNPRVSTPSVNPKFGDLPSMQEAAKNMNRVVPAPDLTPGVQPRGNLSLAPNPPAAFEMPAYEAPSSKWGASQASAPYRVTRGAVAPEVTSANGTRFGFQGVPSTRQLVTTAPEFQGVPSNRALVPTELEAAAGGSGVGAKIPRDYSFGGMKGLFSKATPEELAAAKSFVGKAAGVLGAGIEGYDAYKDVSNPDSGLTTGEKVGRFIEGGVRLGGAALAGAGGSLAGPAGTLAGGYIGYQTPEILRDASNRYLGTHIQLPSDKAKHNAAVAAAMAEADKRTAASEADRIPFTPAQPEKEAPAVQPQAQAPQAPAQQQPAAPKSNPLAEETAARLARIPQEQEQARVQQLMQMALNPEWDGSFTGLGMAKRQQRAATDILEKEYGLKAAGMQNATTMRGQDLTAASSARGHDIESKKADAMVKNAADEQDYKERKLAADQAYREQMYKLGEQGLGLRKDKELRDKKTWEAQQALAAAEEQRYLDEQNSAWFFGDSEAEQLANVQRIRNMSRLPRETQTAYYGDI